jgi:predicted ATPase/DNA-binding SARP family transcriptional activator
MAAGTARAAQATGSIWVGVLGPLRVEVDGRERVVPTGLQRRLLGSLLLARGRVVRTSSLVDDVWGDDPPSAADASLHTAVARLRRTLGSARGVLRTGPGGYQLSVSRRDRDDSRFTDLLGAAEAATGHLRLDLLDQAVGLWRGEAWHDVADDLAVAEAGRLTDLRWRAIEMRAVTLADVGRLSEAVAELRSLVAERPLREQTLLPLVDALDRSGDSVEALAELERYRRRLADDLGLDPSAEVAELQQRILRREQSSSRMGSPPPEPGPTRPVVDASGLLGRAELVATLDSTLGPGKVVTLVGPGGVGKTSLARHLQALAPACWWADLQQVSRPEQVTQAVLAATGGAEGLGGSAEENLAHRLATASGLLVLDNSEHVTETAAWVAQTAVTQGAPVTVLVTSRRRLDVPGEIVIPVPPLRVEPVGPDVAPAVQLFLTRAQEAAHGLQIDEDLLRAAAAICHRVDGLPLAIELAAAQVGSVSLHDLEADLRDHLDLLRTTHKVGVERHRALRETMRWSYELLAPVEQDVFRGVGVFAAEFELAAAQRVVGGLGLSREQVSVALAELVRRSMVVAPHPPGSGRFRLLQTLRTFARESATADEGRALSRARLAWVLRLAEDAGRAVAGPDEALWAARLAATMPDLREAFDDALTARDLDSARRIVQALGRWAYLTLNTEILGWAERLLAVDAEASPRVLVVAATSAWLRDDHTGSLTLAQTALERAEASDLTTQHLAYEALADVALFTGKPDEGREYYRRSAAGALRAGHLADAAMGRAGMALAEAYAGRDGRTSAKEALGMAHRSRNPSAMALAWYTDGEVRGDRDLDGALASLARARAVDTGPVASLSHSVSRTATAALLGRQGALDPTTFTTVADTIEHWKGVGGTAMLLTCLRNAVPLLVRAGLDHEAVLVGEALEHVPTEHVSYGSEAEAVEESLRLAQDRGPAGTGGGASWLDVADAADTVVAALRQAGRVS